MSRIGIARDGTATILQEAVIEMAGGSDGPILGPSHDGTWIILRAAASGHVLRWVCKQRDEQEIGACDDCYPRDENGERARSPWLEIAGEARAIRWLELAE